MAAKISRSMTTTQRMTRRLSAACLLPELLLQDGIRGDVPLDELLCLQQAEAGRGAHFLDRVDFRAARDGGRGGGRQLRTVEFVSDTIMSGRFRPSILDRRTSADQAPPSAAPARRAFVSPRAPSFRRRNRGDGHENHLPHGRGHRRRNHDPGVRRSGRRYAPGISPDEAKRLRYQVQQYHQMQRYAGADGLITRAEQARLDHKVGQLRRLIQLAKTN